MVVNDAVGVSIQQRAVLPNEACHTIPFVLAYASRRPAVAVEHHAVDGRVGVGGKNDAVVQPDTALHKVVCRIVDVTGGINATIGCHLERGQANLMRRIGDAVNQRIVFPNLPRAITIAREIDILCMG